MGTTAVTDRIEALRYKAAQVPSPAVDFVATKRVLDEYGKSGMLATEVFPVNDDFRSAAAVFIGTDSPIEYHVERFVQLGADPSVATRELNKVGAEGWLLVSIYQGGVNNRHSFGIFARQVHDGD